MVDGPKLLRVAHVLLALHTELPADPLDETARHRLAAMEFGLLAELGSAVPPVLLDELRTLVGPVGSAEHSEVELRLILAQMLGWVKGLMDTGPLTPMVP